VGLLASALALSWALSGLLVGRLSDLLRRRKIILVVCAVIFSAASVLSGWVNSFAMLIAAQLGLTMGLGEIIGGVFSPWIAGSIADAHGLRSTLWIMVGLSVATGLLACFLNETAPRVLQGANRQAAPFSSASSRATSRP
jgi:MFS family permease